MVAFGIEDLYIEQQQVNCNLESYGVAFSQILHSSTQTVYFALCCQRMFVGCRLLIARKLNCGRYREHTAAQEADEVFSKFPLAPLVPSL